MTEITAKVSSHEALVLNR